MPTNNKSEPRENGFEQDKFALELLWKEVGYRRDKAWKIFSWVSTILLSVIGGIVALSANSSAWQLEWYHALVLSVSLLALTVYSCLWINKNLSVTKITFDKIVHMEVDMGIRESEEFPIKNPKIGYVFTVILLTVAALIAVWLVPFF